MKIHPENMQTYSGGRAMAGFPEDSVAILGPFRVDFLTICWHFKSIKKTIQILAGSGECLNIISVSLFMHFRVLSVRECRPS